jgi:formylglycine-generating enzyme required for sulfatase activity
MGIEEDYSMRQLSRWWILVVVLAGVGIVGGCSGKREVTGQVFVVTKGGENVKLGLVGIHVVGEKELAGIADLVQRHAATNRANLELLKGLENDVQALVRKAPLDFDSPLKQIEETISSRRLVESMKDSPEVTLFRMLPPLVTQTDADGVFVVQASEKDWLVARGQRRAGDSTENYLWVMQLLGGQKKLLVSNDRLLDDKDKLLRTLGEVSHVETGIGAERSLVSWAAEQRTAGQVALAEAKAAEEKALAEARVREEAEDRERRRLAAESKAAQEKALALAQAKAEAAEAAIASKLALSRPFAQGARGKIGVIFVRWIPSGHFTMGSPSSEKERFPDETQHEVGLSQGFFIAETECTQGQWEMVMGSNPSRFKGANRPVEVVSWSDAVEYCRKLTVKQREESVLPVGWEWRLPTEAEWEYAARAGAPGARPGELEAIAWYFVNSDRETHAVGGKQANAWGMYDMIGNVSEWCSDWYGEYGTWSVTDPKGPSSGSSRINRGGSWNEFSDHLRSAHRDGRFRTGNRYGDPRGFRNDDLGFRPVLSSVR